MSQQNSCNNLMYTLVRSSNEESVDGENSFRFWSGQQSSNPPVDVKVHYVKIGKLTLENNSLTEVLSKPA